MQQPQNPSKGFITVATKRETFLIAAHNLCQSILDHYESHDKVSLTNKIRSLGSLPERSPVVLKDNKYYGDITHRYFQEEIVAIKFVLRLSEQYGVDMKYMKKIYECFISL